MNYVELLAAYDKLEAEHAELISDMQENMAEVIEDLYAELAEVKAELALALKVPSIAAMHTWLDSECAKKNKQLGDELAAPVTQYETVAENWTVAHERIAELEALLGEANTILEIGESINPGCVLHSEIKAALAKKELSE